MAVNPGASFLTMLTVQGEISSNSTFTCEFPIGTTTDAVGNVRLSSQKWTIKASLEQKRSPSRDSNPSQPGNFPAIWLEGHITEILDNAGNHQGWTMPLNSKATLDGTVGDLKGRLYLANIVPCSAIEDFDLLDICGQEIAGWFEVVR